MGGPPASRATPPAAAAAAAPPDADVRALVREEIGGLEREIEKRVRAGVLADLKEWMSKS